jgi:hypothetical protein
MNLTYGLMWRQKVLVTRAQALNRPMSDLQDISFTGDHLIQHRVNEEPEKEPRNQTCDDDDRKRLLGIRSDARGKGRRQ